MKSWRDIEWAQNRIQGAALRNPNGVMLHGSVGEIWESAKNVSKNLIKRVI